ncbi:hypothetical protein LTR64_007133 [Lithohypha guttulata]|uniref:uncharacterized protein n=1 Tax=Lithohypha guttulata TaxID=1690604 RepID=UPI002DE0DF5F|nr:hypothetical protein LTR51_004312 [Lithohypha guttulata]
MTVYSYGVNLLKDIASTFSSISAKDDYGEDSWLTPYHQAFHETLIREWSSIDSHRMNKYLLLVRFVVREIFTICFRPLFGTRTGEKDQLPEKREEEGKIEARHRAKSITATMEASGPLNRTDRKIPDGLRLHLLDVFPEELFTAYTAAEEGSATTEEDAALNAPDQHILGMMLEIFKAPITAMAESNSGAQKHVRQRAKEALQHLAEREAEAFESIGG